ncbi:class III lanthionine synthetase LanKC N-terminal domain-containing protein [Kaarinaea lacus]
MPEIRVPAADRYRVNGRFKVFESMAAVEWGIKIHVSAMQTNAQTVADAVLPICCTANVRHKVIYQSDKINTGDEQSKKFITVYPQSKDDLETLVDDINAKLMHLCRGKGLVDGTLSASDQKIQGDMPYGHSGYVFLRYGNFLADDSNDDRSTVSQKLMDYLLKDEDVFQLSRRAQLAREMGIA